MKLAQKNNNIEWQRYYLPNIPIYETKLPKNVVDHLWGYVNTANKSINHELAGNIDKSLVLVDEEDYFMNNVIAPVAESYIENIDGARWYQNNSICTSKSLILQQFWVNYQNKHDFNPSHAHQGIFSFVIWMRIPTRYEEQHQIRISKNSNSPSASSFQFSYSNILGGHSNHLINMGPHQEGWILIFPSQLQHQVYPFYNCDEQRVSISGNICWN